MGSEYVNLQTLSLTDLSLLDDGEVVIEANEEPYSLTKLRISSNIFKAANFSIGGKPQEFRSDHSWLISLRDRNGKEEGMPSRVKVTLPLYFQKGLDSDLEESITHCVLVTA